jgi:hypothetical protein
MEKKSYFKELSGKAKVQYIWDYYKWRIIIPIILIIVVVYLIHNYISYKEPTLNVTMINSTADDIYDTSMFDGFLDEYGYDAVRNPVSLNAIYQFPDDGSYDYTSAQALRALNIVIYAGGQDLFFGTGSVYTDFSDDGVLCDLSEILSDELMAEYSDDFIYSTAGDTVDAYPCAVELKDNKWLSESGCYDSCYLGVFASADHPEAAAEFMDYVMTQ